MRVRFAARVAPFEVDHGCIAVIEAAPFDRLESRGSLAQPLQRAVDGFFGDVDARTIQGDRGELARVERRYRVERRRERQRLTFFERDVADIGRVDRLDAALAQRVVDGARNKVVRDVVKNLILEPLLDDARRRFAWPETRNLRAPRVVARHTIDFGRDHVLRDLHAHVLARLVDVDEFRFHLSIW